MKVPGLAIHDVARILPPAMANHDVSMSVAVHVPGPQAVAESIGRKTTYYEQLVGLNYSIAGYLREFGTRCPYAKELGWQAGERFDAVIHPAIGMSGWNTQFASLNIAPVQMTAWGHPVTSGMDSIDYYLSGELQEPDNGQDHYTEELVRLPGSGLCYPRIPNGPSDWTKDQLGVPERYLYCAQNILKLTPEYDALFKAVQEETGMALVMNESSPAETPIIKERLASAGVDVHWIPYMKRPEFLRTLQLATASIDPPAWSGGNTTVEAI